MCHLIVRLSIVAMGKRLLMLFPLSIMMGFGTKISVTCTCFHTTPWHTVLYWTAYPASPNKEFICPFAAMEAVYETHPRGVGVTRIFSSLMRVFQATNPFDNLRALGAHGNKQNISHRMAYKWWSEDCHDPNSPTISTNRVWQ